ncbi:MAG TPA: antibiotic biosynthesis monooxygenase [Candidatus Dormibacteraeota bacterium]|nr:antibiotic biosynthesis monooxygenase [Candidatus Dormibacteraeota bacterium]
MHLRMVRLAGSPEALEGAISAFDQVSAPVRKLPGCAGIALLADREGGQAVVVSYWESEEALTASNDAAANARATTVSRHGLEVLDVEQYEVTHLERRQPLQPGVATRLVSVQATPDRIDEIQRELRARAVPILTALSGYRSVLQAVNRSNGKLIAASSWETAADREASNAQMAGVREYMQEMTGGSPPQVENLEVVFADLGVAAEARPQ